MKIQLLDSELEFQEATALLGDERILDDLDPDAAKTLHSADLIKGSHVDDSAARLEFNSSFEVEAVNRSNPEIVEVPDDDDDERLLQRRRYPWSYDGSETALIYRITGTVKGGIETGNLPVASGGSARLGLQAGSTVGVSHVRLHERETPVGVAVASDLGDGSGFRFALDPRHLTRLDPGREYLMAEFQAGFSFSADFSWGQVFRAKPALVRSFFSGGSMLAAGSNRPIEAAVVAEARVRTSYATRLQLISSMVDDKTARFEFRKASAGTLGISAGVRVTADGISRADARAALSGLLSRAVGNLGLDPASFDQRLGELAAFVSSARDRYDLTEFYDAANEPLKRLSGEWSGKLSLGLTQLLGFKERFGDFWEVLDSYQTHLSFPEERFRQLTGKIDAKLAELAAPALPEPYRTFATTILESPGFSGNTLVTLSAFLAIPDYERKAAELVEGAAERLPELRQEVLRLVDRLDLEQVLDQDGWDLLRLVEERTGMPVAEIAAAISSRELMAKFIEAGTGLSVDGILAKLAVFDPEGIELPENLRELGIALESWFGIPVSRLPDKLNTLLDQIAGALPLVAEASATFEFSRKKENESLFDFEFTGLDDPAAAAVLTEIHGGLLRGDLDAALDAYRDPAHRSRFRNFEFFAAETVERRASFRLRFLSTLQNQEGTSVRRKTTNIDGAVDLQFSECASFDNQIGSEIKTRASGSTLLTASSKGFVAKGEKNAKDFSYRLETSLAWAGKVKLKDGGILPQPERKRNRRMLEFFGQLLDESGKLTLPSGNVASLLNELFEEAEKDDLVELKFQIVLEPEMVELFWKSAPPLDWGGKDANRGVFMANYDWARRKLEDIQPAGTSDDAIELANFNQYFNALARLAESARSDGIDRFDERLRTWRRRHNRTGSILWKIDKYGYAAALVKTMPAGRPGWILSASLKLGEKQIFLA